MRTVIYPGSFDPLTKGHLDVIERAARVFDHVVVAVARNESKTPLFSIGERLEFVRADVAHLPNVEADSFDGLLVNYVVSRGACAVVRGLRAVSDFEFEFQLALMNRRLNERVETLFMTPRETYTFVSSRLVKEIARLGGDVSQFVPPRVAEALRARFAAPPLRAQPLITRSSNSDPRSPFRRLRSPAARPKLPPCRSRSTSSSWSGNPSISPASSRRPKSRRGMPTCSFP